MAGGTYRELALQRALTFEGTKEHPANSNDGPMIRKWLANTRVFSPAPWCMAFANSMFLDVGLDLKYRNEASVGFFQDWAAQRGWIVKVPRRGDLVCYKFDSDDWPDHVGFVISAGANRIVTIEGNTAIGNDANGGMVMKRTRAISRCAFVRIPGVAPTKAPAKPKKANIWDDLPGPKPKPPWFWPAYAELTTRVREAKENSA